jgi:uncharacterized protein (TIGR02145 family)
MAKKRAFVRYSKQGKVVPGSLILTSGSYPNGPSTWKEIPADLCCGDICPPATSFCTENWAFENFDGTTFRNGDEIPQVQDSSAWAALTTPAWCYIYDALYGTLYGKLYNGYAIVDPRGLAPEGWRIPLQEDWQNLFNCIDCDLNDQFFGPGSKLKTSGFQDDNTGLWSGTWGISSSTNEYGFSILPAGVRTFDGQFLSATDFTTTIPSTNISSIFWTQEENVVNPGWVGTILFPGDFHWVLAGGNPKTFGCSLRLIKEI